jgi:hypothetical protein
LNAEGGDFVDRLAEPGQLAKLIGVSLQRSGISVNVTGNPRC